MNWFSKKIFYLRISFAGNITSLPPSSLDDKIDLLKADLDSVSKIQETTESEPANLMNVKEEGEWSIVCDEPIDKSKSIISKCKGVVAQLEESLKKELQLQESVGVLELDLSRLSEEIQEINAL